MNKLVEGEWRTDLDSTDESGAFVREETTFRDRIADEPGATFPPEAGRYHLYVSYACPWAHRTLIARRLLGLDPAIGVSVVDPYRDDDGWQFSPKKRRCTADAVHDVDYLRELYQMADPDATCRVSVPVLWDTKTDRIVNNESREILRMFDTAFADVGDRSVTLYPDGYREEIDRIIDEIYRPINNGVYRAGFAKSQAAYDEAVDELFASLGYWNDVLDDQRYLAGPVFTEADVCMFTTLIRFDSVYHTHFKCNASRVVDFDNLWPYLRDLYQTPGVAETVDMAHITEHYYRTHPEINPSGIVARGPTLPLADGHDRDRLPGGPPKSGLPEPS